MIVTWLLDRILINLISSACLTSRINQIQLMASEAQIFYHSSFFNLLALNKSHICHSTSGTCQDTISFGFTATTDDLDHIFSTIPCQITMHSACVTVLLSYSTRCVSQWVNSCQLMTLTNSYHCSFTFLDKYPFPILPSVLSNKLTWNCRDSDVTSSQGNDLNSHVLGRTQFGMFL